MDVNINTDFIYNTVEKWLAIGQLPAGKALHISTIIASQLGRGNYKLGIGNEAIPWKGPTGLAVAAILTNPDINANVVWNMVPASSDLDPRSNAQTSFRNTLQRVLADPNIEGIVLCSPKVEVDRDIDVNESATIIQDGLNREYNVDNAVPRLRRWTIDGYIKALNLSADHGQVIKPSLVMQRDYLDACAVSRRPVWFKDNNNMFYQVLINRLHSEQTPEAMNAIRVNIELVEYKPLTITSSLVGIIKMIGEAIS